MTLLLHCAGATHTTATFAACRTTKLASPYPKKGAYGPAPNAKENGSKQTAVTTWQKGYSVMINPENVPEEVWRSAMSTYHKTLRKNPGMAWQAAISAAITSWPHVALSTHVEEGRRIILPLHEKDG